MKPNQLLLAILVVAGLCCKLIAQQGDNTALSLAWHEESDAVFSRGYVLTAGIDIDQDRKGEILTYDGDGGKRIVYLFEASADNTYDVVWSYQFSDGWTGIVGGERGIMVTDLDNDGFEEITVIMDSDAPGAGGFNAGHIFEWDGTDNGLPTTPTATFDPPRDAWGQVRLEYNTRWVQMDDDANLEIVMTHRGGHGTFLSIIELQTSDVASGVTVVPEFTETFDEITDPVHYAMRNTGFGITDIDGDGLNEIIMFDDNTGLVRVYENTGTDAYALVAEWQPNPTGWVAGATVKSRIPALDLDINGVDELYLADTRGNTWIITPNGTVATMFDNANWHLLHDWKVGNVYIYDGEVRGCLPGDVDQDNKPDIYFAGNNFGSILDMEYDGGAVTNGDNYSYYVTAIDANDAVDGGHFARPCKIALSDMDGDGHLEVVTIVPWTGGNPVDNLRGLYVFEHHPIGPPSAPTNLTASPSDGRVVTLTWSANTESDLAKYRIYRDISSPATTLIDSVVGFPPDSSFTDIGLINGTTYYYRITAVDLTYNESDFSTEVNATPVNSPPVALLVYDLRGREVARLLDGDWPAGYHQVVWDGRDRRGREVPTGIYIARLTTPTYAKSIKLVLLK